MDPVFAVVDKDPAVQVQPAPQKNGLGPTPPPPQAVQGGGWRVRREHVLHLIFFLVVGGTFGVLIYLKRHSTRDIVLLVGTHTLGTTLGICNLKLRKLRGDHTRDPAEVAIKIRRLKIAMGVLLVALGCTIAVTLCFTVHGVALKVVVCVVIVVVLAVLFYFLFFRKDADGARRPATGMHELSHV